MYGRRRKSPFSMGDFSLFQVRIELLVWLLGTVMADAVGKVHNRVALDVCFWKPLQIIRQILPLQLFILDESVGEARDKVTAHNCIPSCIAK